MQTYTVSRPEAGCEGGVVLRGSGAESVPGLVPSSRGLAGSRGSPSPQEQQLGLCLRTVLSLRVYLSVSPLDRTPVVLGRTHLTTAF